MHKVLVIFLFALIFAISSIASLAFEKNDSLISKINSINDLNLCLYTIEDTLPEIIRSRNTETVDFLFNRGFEIANKLKADTSIAFLYLHKGTNEYYFGNYIQAQDYFQMAIDKYLRIADGEKTYRVKLNEANAYNNLGIINKKQGRYAAALVSFQVALSIRSSINDSIQIANTYMNIGNLYNAQRDIHKSKEYYTNARNTYLNLNNEFGLATATHNLGLINELIGDYDEALKSYKLSYQMFKKLERLKPMATSLNNLGNIFLILNEIDSVKPTLDAAYKVYSEMQDSVGICSVLINYGNYYSKIEEKDLAESYLLKALDLTKSENLIDSEISTTKILAEHYSSTEDYAKAFFYLSMAFQLEEEYKSEIDEERFHKLDEYYREEANKQRMAIKELELKNSKTLLKNNQEFTLILIISLVIIFVLLAFQFLKYNSTNAIKKELEATNSELSRINEEYKQTLISKEEKEILLQEIHHRVKNNLQIINSLLRFQALKGSEESRELILELQSRITAMSLLHEQLYMNKDFTKINVKDYLELLLNNLSSAYNKEHPIFIDRQIEIENLDLDTLHPLGLLINEIISNSLKHAFNENSGVAKIYLKFYIENGVHHLKMGDNGVGFNKEKFSEPTNNLGIELIGSLTNQLDGTIEVLIDKGTHYHIQFSISKKAEILSKDRLI